MIKQENLSRSFLCGSIIYCNGRTTCNDLDVTVNPANREINCCTTTRSFISLRPDDLAAVE